MEILDPTLINILIIVIYLLSLFVFFEIKSKLMQEIVPTFTYLILVVSILILIRIINLFITFNIIYIPFLQEIAILMMAVFIFLASVNFLRFLKSEIDEEKEKKAKEKKPKVKKYSKNKEEKKKGKEKKSKHK